MSKLFTGISNLFKGNQRFINPHLEDEYYIANFDAAFKANSVGKKYIQLAGQVEIVDTILIYLSNWFSKGIPYELTPSGERIDESPLIDLINNPNPYQSRPEFLAEFYYYLLAAGTNYIYPVNKSVGFEGTVDNTALINLNFDNVVEPQVNSSIFDLNTEIGLKYLEHLGNGLEKEKLFNFQDIIPFFDSTNGMGGKIYKGKSRLETIKDEIKNIHLAVKAKQNKIDLSGITLVTPETKSGNELSLGLDKPVNGLLNKEGKMATQKDHIEGKFKASGLSKGRSIIVGSTELKAMNLTESLENIKFDPLRIEDCRTIKRKYGISENILQLTDRSEKANQLDQEILSLIQNSIEPIAMNLAMTLSKRYENKNKLMFDYTHLPVYAIKSNEKAQSDERIGAMIKSFVDSQIITTQEAKRILIDKGVLQ